MKEEIHNLLIKNDGKNWETPDGYKSNRKIMIKAEEIQTKFQEKYNSRITLDKNVQDASFVTDIRIFDKKYFDEEKGFGSHVYELCFRFSAFGNMFTMFGNNLEKYNTKEMINHIIGEGFIYIEEEDLNTKYDGKYNLTNENTTWWIRYFDYI